MGLIDTIIFLIVPVPDSPPSHRAPIGYRYQSDSGAVSPLCSINRGPKRLQEQCTRRWSMRCLHRLPNSIRSVGEEGGRGEA